MRPPWPVYLHEKLGVNEAGRVQEISKNTSIQYAIQNTTDYIFIYFGHVLNLYDPLENSNVS